MLITGTHKCENCDSDIEWEYQFIERIRHGIILDVDKIDKTKVRPKLISKNDNDEYLFQVRCKKCFEINEFIYCNEEIL